MRFQILIPTFNRSNDLLKNLNHLSEIIENERKDHQVEIVISDNCSEDNTIEAITQFKKTATIPINYHRNESNIGLEKNMVVLMELAETEFVMFTGDDDFIPTGYLSFCLNQIETNRAIGSIIPGRVSLFEDGSIDTPERDQDVKIWEPGYEGAYNLSHFGSQLSGLVFRNPKELADAYLNCGYTSIYLFIYWLAYLNLKFSSVQAFGFLVKVTTFNVKDWSYNQHGYLDEIFRAYLPFKKELSNEELVGIMAKFVKMHGWRFGIEVTRPVKSVKKLFALFSQIERIPKLRRTLFQRFVVEYFVQLMN